MNTIKEYFLRNYKWYSQNVPKIVFVVGLHIISSYIVNLPYINILASLFSFLPFFFDWIAILILFKPSKNQILKIGLLLFVFGYFVGLLKVSSVLEIVGQASFFAIATCVFLSLKEIKKD